MLLLLSVTLDFANPLLPGAVRFEAGAVESVQGDRTTRVQAPTIPGPERRPAFIVPPAVVARVWPVPAARVPTRSPRRDARKVTPPRRADLPSSTTEDH